MIELLKLCGFKEQEIESELPRVEKAFNKLGISAEDIERGKQRLAKYFDIELEGVRKIFRLIVLEVVDSVLAREEGKKIISGFMAEAWELISSVLESKSEKVSSKAQCWAFLLLLGHIFDKTIPIFEAAEKKWLKAGMVAHCGNVKTIVGLIDLGLFPKPDLLVTAGALCETAPKTLDLLHELYDIPICIYDTCRDRDSREHFEATARSVDLVAKSLRKIFERIQEVVGFEITDDMLLEAMDARAELEKALGKLRGVIGSGDLLPLSASHDMLWFFLAWGTFSINTLPDAIDAANTLCEELQDRVDKGLGAVEKGAPRVLAMMPPGHADPRLEHLASELGIAIVATDAQSAEPFPNESVSKEKDLCARLMSPFFQASLFLSPARRIPLIIEECKRLKVDGVLGRFHAGCRGVAGDALLIKDAVEKELGIPVLLLEWESYDPRVYNHAEYKRRLEVFKATMVRRSG